MAKKVGLPEFVKSRHDNHFVEEISTRTRTSIIRKIPIEKIVPNMLQPRKDFGNIEELAESIKEKGILEPILVRARDGKFEIIAGERRYRAAKFAGMSEVPCIDYDIPDNEALELSIIENIQRKDLTIYEQAYSLKSLTDIYGYTHEDIAKKLSKSRVTVSELIRITDLPNDIISKCMLLKIESKSFLLQLVKLEDKNQMIAALEKYSEKPYSREILKKERKEKDSTGNKDREIPFKYKFTSEDKSVKINFNIKSGDQDKKTVLLKVLENLIDNIKNGKIDKFDI
ncbi:MAG: ParB/RepB/Spo0J family partition protein [Acidobacteriota bacterium]